MCTILMVLEVILMVLELILVVLGLVLVMVLHGAQRQCREQMFGTGSVRNTIPSQHRFPGLLKSRWDPIHLRQHIIKATPY